MTLSELYEQIGGDYTRATNVLRVEKLIDKHIRKFKDNELIPKLSEAFAANDAVQVFEITHALKGVCANLGLLSIADLASEITEDYRVEGQRKFTDEEIKEKIDKIEEIYQKTKEGIRQYEESLL